MTRSIAQRLGHSCWLWVWTTFGSKLVQSLQCQVWYDWLHVENSLNAAFCDDDHRRRRCWIRATGNDRGDVARQSLHGQSVCVRPWGSRRVVMETEEAGGLTSRRGWARPAASLLICSHKLYGLSPGDGVVCRRAAAGHLSDTAARWSCCAPSDDESLQVASRGRPHWYHRYHCYAVVRWLAGWLGVCHIRVLCRNCYRQSCYRMRIENRTQAFEWYHFQWPWVTSNPNFKIFLLHFNVK